MPHCPPLSWAINILKEKNKGKYTAATVGAAGQQGQQGQQGDDMGVGHHRQGHFLARAFWQGEGCQMPKLGSHCFLRLGELEALIGHIPCQHLYVFVRASKLSRIEQGR